MKKISQSFLLKCGFQYEYIANKMLAGFKLLNNAKFVLSYWEYDVELDGEIEKQIVCFKTWGKWVLIQDKKSILLNSIEDLLSLGIINNIEFNMKFIYIIYSKLGYKIGRTKNIDDRNAIFNVKLPFKWNFQFIYGVKHPKKIEKFLHHVLYKNNLNGEWFNLNNDELLNVKQFIINNSDYLTSFNSPLNNESPTLK